MLHIKTVEPRTFSLLKELMAMPELLPFSLVGGTTLSLLYGHRSSVHLDLFYHEKFDVNKIAGVLESNFQSRFVYKNPHTGFGIFCFIDDVKVDLVYYPHLPIAINISDYLR